MPATVQTAIAAIGIDIGKNSFHILGLDDRGRNCAASEVVATEWRYGLPTFHRARSASRPALVLIISVARLTRRGAMRG
jgi:hypothetical protein